MEETRCCPTKPSQASAGVMARKFHPIGIRFQRLTAHIVPPQGGGAWSTDRKRVKMYFVVADERHKSMCRYYWEEGDIGTPADTQYQLQVFDANADDVAPTGFRNEVFGVEGGGVVPMELDPLWTFDIDGLAQVRTKANAGIVTASSSVFTVYVHDVDIDAEGPSPRFRLRFHGSPPGGSRSRGHERAPLPTRPEADIRPQQQLAPEVLTERRGRRGAAGPVRQCGCLSAAHIESSVSVWHDGGPQHRHHLRRGRRYAYGERPDRSGARRARQHRHQWAVDYRRPRHRSEK